MFKQREARLGIGKQSAPTLTRRRFAGAAVVAGAAATMSQSALAGPASHGVPTAIRGQGKSVEIEYWNINTEIFGLPQIKELVADFQKKNPTITVTPVSNQGSYTQLMEKMQAAMAAKRPGDVAQIGYLYNDYVSKNFPFTPMDDLAKQHGDEEFFKPFASNILDLGKVGGKQIGMPYALSDMVAYYNPDMFKQAKLDVATPPKTWDEWKTAAQAIKDATGKPGIYIQVVDDNWAPQAMIESNGGEILTCDNGNVKAAFGEDPAVEAIDLWASLIKDGLALMATQEQGIQAFLSGNVGSYFTTIARSAGLKEQAKFDVQAAPSPAFGDKPVKLPAGGNSLFVFSQDDAKKEAAWEFVKYLQSPAAMTIWVKGTGYLPTRADLSEDANYLKSYMDENPIAKIALEQMPSIVPWTSFPGDNGLQASKVLADSVEKAIGGQSSAKDALGNGEDEVNGLLAGEKCS